MSGTEKQQVKRPQIRQREKNEKQRKERQIKKKQIKERLKTKGYDMKKEDTREECDKGKYNTEAWDEGKHDKRYREKRHNIERAATEEYRAETYQAGRSCAENGYHAGEKIRKIVGFLIVLLTPAAMYGIFEYVTGNISRISFLYTLLNLSIYYLIYILLFTMAGSTRLIYPFLNGVLTVMSLAEYYVVEFRGRPIMLGDIMAFRTALTVSANYEYNLTPRLTAAIFSALCLSIAAILYPARLRGWKWHGGAFLAVAMITGLCGIWFYTKGIKSSQIEINMWDPANSYKENGYILSTFYAFSYLSVKPPDGYSPEEAQNIGRMIREEYRPAGPEGTYLWQIPETEAVPENIICIMNESFSDLSINGEFRTNIPYLEYYDSLEENCMKGNLYMPVFGAMTCNSEYEFLTGNAMSFAPPSSVPYQVYADQTVYGLPLTLKSQGYRTVAIHPYPAQNWNREQVFEEMGFDLFLADEDFKDFPTIRGYISDKGTYDKIIDLTESKQPGERLFVFDITMQNHGGYTQEDYEGQVYLEDFKDMPKTEQYLSLVRESDEALRYLLDYYEKSEESTMIVLFGDHQPGIEEEFYEAVNGKPMEEISEEEYVRRFITPFLIWTNYSMPSEKIDKISAAYLSNIIVERANLQPTDFQIFMDAMYAQAPVIHPLGYYNSSGIWSNWDNWKTKPEYPIFKNYYILAYNNMMARRKRAVDIFSIIPMSR
ncbi:LTA synthase family protein [Lachnospiraceae bacterium 62-35]